MGHAVTLTAPQANASDTAQSLNSLRNETWRMAYSKLRMEQEDMMKAYERLVKEENCIDQETQLGPETMADVVSRQASKMKNKQWSYTVLGQQRAVRDDVETIFGVLQQASGLISFGMAAAPPFVSLPW